METEWKDVVEAKPQEATTVNVFASLDDYYNYGYRDESKWLCLRLSGTDGQDFCYAYVDRTSANMEDYANLDDRAPARLSLKFVPGAKPNQAEVVEFFNIGWMGD